MNKYYFVAKSVNNEKFRGYIKAEDVETLKKIIIEHNYQLLKYRLIKEKKQFITFSNIKKTDLLSFCEKLKMIVSTGISISDALILCSSSITNRQFSKIINEMGKEINKGKSLSQVIGEYPKIFPSYFRTMIKLAEMSGNLKSVLDHLINHYRDEIQLRKKFFSSLFYPCLLAILCIAVIIVICKVIIPTFVNIFTEMKVDLPLITRIMIGISNFVNQYGGFIVLLLVVIIIAFIIYFNTSNGKIVLDKIKLKIPVFGKITTSKIATSFCQCLYILLNSGIPIIVSLQTTLNLIDNKYVKKRFNFALDEVKRGGKLSSALYTMNVFPILLIETISISERTASLESSLLNLEHIFFDETQTKLQRFSSLIEPTFILIIASIVVILIASIFIPLFSMLDNIGGM